MKCLSIIKYEHRKAFIRPLAWWVLDLWVNKVEITVCQLSYIPGAILTYACACTSVQYKNTFNHSHGKNRVEKQRSQRSLKNKKAQGKTTRKKSYAKISKSHIFIFFWFWIKSETRKQGLPNPFSITNCLKKLKAQNHFRY